MEIRTSSGCTKLPTFREPLITHCLLIRLTMLTPLVHVESQAAFSVAGNVTTYHSSWQPWLKAIMQHIKAFSRRTLSISYSRPEEGQSEEPMMKRRKLDVERFSREYQLVKVRIDFQQAVAAGVVRPLQDGFSMNKLIINDSKPMWCKKVEIQYTNLVVSETLIDGEIPTDGARYAFFEIQEDSAFRVRNLLVSYSCTAKELVENSNGNSKVLFADSTTAALLHWLVEKSRTCTLRVYKPCVYPEVECFNVGPITDPCLNS